MPTRKGPVRWPQRRGMRIKSIQRGTIAITGTASTATATITAVVTSLTELYYMGQAENQTATGFSGTNAIAAVSLTNSTTITATRTGTSSTINPTIAYEVVEWEEAPIGRAMRIKSIQSGTITVPAALTGTATVTAVDTARSILRHLGHSPASTASVQAAAKCRLMLTNATTITATKAVGNDSTVIGYQITEWEEINVAA